LTLFQSVLDISDRSRITTVAQIDLSRGEDSVQSLGSLATRDGLIAFAGINSSQADQNAGKNEHLRAFDIRYPPRKKQRTEKSDGETQGSVTPISKCALFAPSTAAKKETYQRLLRLSPARKRESGGKRIGAIATGMAKDSEVVVFNATNASPGKSDVLTRIVLDEGQEATDLDIAAPEEAEFSVAYCTDYDIHEQTFKYDFASKQVEKMPKGPRRIHQMPFPDSLEKPQSRPKFRSLRFLNPQNLVVLANKADKSGAELRIFHLYPTGPATMVLQKTLPFHIRQAVAVDVCALDADRNGNQQLVVAVAGQDISIEVYTTNYQRNTDTFSPFKHHLTLRNVHEHQMTKMCFSPFHPPARAPDPEGPTTGPNGEPIPQKAETFQHPGPQYIRLASVTYGNSVVVDTFPLTPLDPKDKHSRYVLSHPNDEAWTKWAYIAIITLIVAVVAFMIQAFASGFSGDSAGPFSILPAEWRDFLDRPAAAASGYQRGAQHSISKALADSLPSNMPGKARLRELLSAHRASPDSNTRALVVRDGPDGFSVSVDVHPDKQAYLKQDTRAKHWDELAEHQKAAWKQRLIQAGEWAESEGESVLLGVLFSEYAGLVGEVARGAIRG